MPVTGKRQIQHAKMPKNAKGLFKKRQFFSPLWVVELEHFSAYLGLSHAIFRKTLSCIAGSYCPRVIHFFEFYESEKKGSLLTIYRGV
jgi:hypothetical protein